MQIIKDSAQFVVPVSTAEKARAFALREKITDFVKYVSEFQEFFQAFFESLEKIQTPDQLIPIGNLLVRYKYKLREKFNSCIKSLSLVVVAYRDLFQESKADSIRDVVVALFSEIRSDFIELMWLMSDYSADDFILKGKEKYDEINKTLEKVLDTCQGEWISHIDKNVLGKIKLSKVEFSLVRKGGI